jgi:spore coat polysaccharide biosynthesis protein SpsF
MRVVVIVQARMGSTRLPGKVLLKLGTKTVLAHVLERAAKISGIDGVVCAVPEGPENDSVAATAQAANFQVHRGPERDVLRRYLGAAEAVQADAVIRVTSDCPLFDPAVGSALVALHAETGADYSSNIEPRSYPKGLDCEMFGMATLRRADEAAKLPDEREHVTSWMIRAPELRRANLASGRASLADMRWTLDYPEDFAFFEAVWAKNPDAGRLGMDGILAILAEYPEIAAINASIKQ